MDRRVLAVVVALVVLIGGSIGAFALLRSPAAAPSISTPPAAESATGSGTYVDYSETAIAEADGRALLFFYAPWCGQCRDIESDILTLGVPDDVTIIKVDFDSHQDLRQEYGVTMRTTFVELDDAGAELQRFVAYDTPSLQAVIDAML